MDRERNRTRKRRVNQQRRSLRLFFFLIAGCCCCVGGIYFLQQKSYSTVPKPALLGLSETEPSYSMETEPQTETETEPETEPKDEVIAALEELAHTTPQVQEILDHQDEYPRTVLRMLAFNEETLDFVLHYPEKKGTACQVDTIDAFEYGTIPQLIQWDERWGYQSYGSSIIAVSGCGPTALAMVAAGLTGDASITPAVVASYAEENNYYIEGEGTSWELMSAGCYHFGIGATELQLVADTIRNELVMGHPVICSMGPGDFTTDGHFIVLTDWTDEGIRINDPNSKKRSEQLWDYERLEGQIMNIWSFYLLY